MTFTKEKFAIPAKQIEGPHDQIEKEGYISINVLKLYDYYPAKKSS